jgi:hypothetical protein
MDSTQIEALERATVLAVSPDDRTEIPGWILPFDAGTVGRARSAVPLAHTQPPAAVLQQIEAAYAQRQLPVMLRIPVLPAFESFRALLALRGYREEIPTEVHIATAVAVRAVSDGEPTELLAAPDAAWASVFLGEGFDPVDGASRRRRLQPRLGERARHAHGAGPPRPRPGRTRARHARGRGDRTRLRTGVPAGVGAEHRGQIPVSPRRLRACVDLFVLAPARVLNRRAGTAP